MDTNDAINTALTILLGDKIAASRLEKLSEILKQVHAGQLSVDDARAAVRHQDDDALDKAIADATD